MKKGESCMKKTKIDVKPWEAYETIDHQHADIWDEKIYEQNEKIKEIYEELKRLELQNASRLERGIHMMRDDEITTDFPYLYQAYHNEKKGEFQFFDYMPQIPKYVNMSFILRAYERMLLDCRMLQDLYRVMQKKSEGQLLEDSMEDRIVIPQGQLVSVTCYEEAKIQKPVVPSVPGQSYEKPVQKVRK